MMDNNNDDDDKEENDKEQGTWEREKKGNQSMFFLFVSKIWLSETTITNKPKQTKTTTKDDRCKPEKGY